MYFKFKINGREVRIEAKVCRNFFSKILGLMFRKKSKPLLFIFRKRKRRAIHSFFCVPFYAFWFDGDKLIEKKLVNPWEFSVIPDGNFDKLLEIPSNDPAFSKLSDEYESFKY